MQHLYIFIAGVVFGVANVIPGVSGGTMAVVFGIYDRLIGLIADLRHRWRKELPFILALGAGAVAGILALSRAMEALFEHFPIETSFFFFGVVLGSLPLIGKNAARGGLSPRIGIAFLATLAFTVLFSLLGGGNGEAGGGLLAPVLSANSLPVNMLVFLLCGAVAAVAMLIPGISGSFVLMILGAYWSVIGAVNEMNLLLLAPFGVGVLAGLVLCAKLVKLLMEKFPSVTYAAIAGFVAGSLVGVYPAAYTPASGIWGPLFAILGCAVIVIMNHFSRE